MGRGQPGVRTGRDGDLVLAAVSTRISATPVAVCSRVTSDVRPDAVAASSAASASAAELVVAERRDEHDRHAEPRRGDGLVAALAAVEPLERPAQDRLAGLRQPLRLDDEVDVDRPDDEDPAGSSRLTPAYEPVTNSPPSTPMTSPLMNSAPSPTARGSRSATSCVVVIRPVGLRRSRPR